MSSSVWPSVPSWQLCNAVFTICSSPSSHTQTISVFSRDLVGFLCHSRCPSEVDIGSYLSLVLRTSAPGFISHSSLRWLLGLLLLPTFLHSLNVRSLFLCLLHLPWFILDMPSVNPVIQELSCLHVFQCKWKYGWPHQVLRSFDLITFQVDSGA